MTGIESAIASAVHVATGRVSSVDNVLADWLSRGLVDEVVRVAQECGYTAVQLDIPPTIRDMSNLPPSRWTTGSQ